MLKLCDHYANNFNILFNASKSKCLIVRPRVKPVEILVTLLTLTFFGGRVIEIVDECPNIDHIISSRFDDSADILNLRNCMIEQINNVICFFGKLDSTTKLNL